MSRSAPTAPSLNRLRLLSCNILAGGTVDRYRQYVTRGLTHVLPGAGKLANLDRLAILAAEFDLVGLQEADAGSLRSGFLNQTQYLAQAAGMPFWSDQPNRRVVRLARSANGLLSRLVPRKVLGYPLPGKIPGRGALVAHFGQGQNALVVVVVHRPRRALLAPPPDHDPGAPGLLADDRSDINDRPCVLNIRLAGTAGTSPADRISCRAFAGASPGGADGRYELHAAESRTRAVVSQHLSAASGTSIAHLPELASAPGH